MLVFLFLRLCSHKCRAAVGCRHCSGSDRRHGFQLPALPVQPRTGLIVDHVQRSRDRVQGVDCTNMREVWKRRDSQYDPSSTQLNGAANLAPTFYDASHFNIAVNGGQPGQGANLGLAENDGLNNAAEVGDAIWAEADPASSFLDIDFDPYSIFGHLHWIQVMRAQEVEVLLA